MVHKAKHGNEEQDFGGMISNRHTIDRENGAAVRQDATQTGRYSASNSFGTSTSLTCSRSNFPLSSSIENNTLL